MESSAPSTSEERRGENWPVIYQLPTFPTVLQLALDQQDASFTRMGKSPERANLMQILFDNITSYTWYACTCI